MGAIQAWLLRPGYICLVPDSSVFCSSLSSLRQPKFGLPWGIEGDHAQLSYRQHCSLCLLLDVPPVSQGLSKASNGTGFRQAGQGMKLWEGSGSPCSLCRLQTAVRAFGKESKALGYFRFRVLHLSICPAGGQWELCSLTRSQSFTGQHTS